MIFGLVYRCICCEKLKWKTKETHKVVINSSYGPYRDIFMCGPCATSINMMNEAFQHYEDDDIIFDDD